jgi:hypothetical protein
MKEGMVTKFYSANPKNRRESRGAGDFTNHYSLITIHVLRPGLGSDLVPQSP